MTRITFWGVTASPYQLKMQALADAAGITWRRAPEQVGRTQALAMAWRLRRAMRAESIERLPARVAGLDGGNIGFTAGHVREWQASMNTLPYLSIPWTEKRFTTIPADSPTTWSYSSQVCGEHCPWSRACASYAS